jgi:hypothetical protein
MYSLVDAAQDTHTKQRPITKVTTYTFFAIIYKKIFLRNRWILQDLISDSNQNVATIHEMQ